MSNLKHQNDAQLVDTLRYEAKRRELKTNKIERLELERNQLERTIGLCRGDIVNSFTRTEWASYYLIGGKSPNED